MRDDFGGQAIELAGRVIHPSYQGQGIGSEMLREFLKDEEAPYITAYTRNLAVLKMIRRVSESVYPLDNDETLREIAQQMPNATADSRAVYHIKRYGESGLFQGFDPADRPVGGKSLKEQFPRLQSIRHALVVAARINMEKE